MTLWVCVQRAGCCCGVVDAPHPSRALSIAIGRLIGESSTSVLCFLLYVFSHACICGRSLKNDGMLRKAAAAHNSNITVALYGKCSVVGVVKAYSTVLHDCEFLTTCCEVLWFLSVFHPLYCFLTLCSLAVKRQPHMRLNFSVCGKGVGATQEASQRCFMHLCETS